MDLGSPSTEVGEDTDFGATGPTLVPRRTALGFTRIESCTANVDSLTEEQLNAHILQLLQSIEALELP